MDYEYICSCRLIVMLKTSTYTKKNDDKHKSFGKWCERTYLFPSLKISSGATGSIISLHLSHSKFSSACNLLCWITLFVSCVTFLTAHYKHWNYFGLVSSLSCLCSDETVSDAEHSLYQEVGKIQTGSFMAPFSFLIFKVFSFHF